MLALATSCSTKSGVVAIGGCAEKEYWISLPYRYPRCDAEVITNLVTVGLPACGILVQPTDQFRVDTNREVIVFSARGDVRRHDSIFFRLLTNSAIVLPQVRLRLKATSVDDDIGRDERRASPPGGLDCDVEVVLPFDQWTYTECINGRIGVDESPAGRNFDELSIWRATEFGMKLFAMPLRSAGIQPDAYAMALAVAVRHQTTAGDPLTHVLCTTVYLRSNDERLIATSDLGSADKGGRRRHLALHAMSVPELVTSRTYDHALARRARGLEHGDRNRSSPQE
jgi:hypothetical protein